MSKIVLPPLPGPYTLAQQAGRQLNLMLGSDLTPIIDAMRAHAAAEVAAARDCHTCAHYVGGKCWADVCTDADRYEALPVVKLWRTA